MTDLERQQRSLLALLKKRPLQSDGDEYLGRVAASEELCLLREIAVWWRKLGIERNCPHTTLLLKRIGRFEDAVETFYCQHATSPYAEAMAAQFTELVSTDPDALVCSVARFELAVLRASMGDTCDFVIEWDRDPTAVLDALHSGGPLPGPSRTYRIKVSGAGPSTKLK